VPSVLITGPLTSIGASITRGGDAESGVRVVLNDGVVRELAQQLVRVGSNLNQVTRLAHIEARDRGLDVGSGGRVVAVIDQTRATIAALDSRLEAMSAS